MCVRISPLTEDEARSALEARGSGAHAIHYIEGPAGLGDAYPGARVPVYVPGGEGALEVEMLEWGLPLEGRPTPSSAPASRPPSSSSGSDAGACGPRR